MKNKNMDEVSLKQGTRKENRNYEWEIKTKMDGINHEMAREVWL